MNSYEEKLKQYICENNIKAEHLTFTQSCHSVFDAAKAVGAEPTDFVKNICMIDTENNLIVGIVKGEDKVDRVKVANLLSVDKLKMATPDQILRKTGYPCGGTPSFSYPATFLIDPQVMEKKAVYSGGGSAQSVVKISPVELQKANFGKIVGIRII